MKQRDDWHLTEIIGHELGRGDPFAAAIRGTRMPMIITDPRQDDNPIVFANAAFQDLVGYERDEIIGRNCRFLQGPDTDQDALQRLRQAIADETAINVELRNYRKDGSAFWNSLFVSPVRSEGGEVQFFFASQIDITHRVEAEQALARQKEEVEAQVRARTQDLETALEAKTLLLNEVDHRVKNNLTMIGSLLRLQMRSIPDPKFRETLETMLERIDALAAVHRRLYQADDVTRFDVGAFAESLASDVLGASGRGDIRLRSNCEAVAISADKAAPVGLILNELITNAVKHAYGDGRGGELSLDVRQSDGHALIDLRDDGPGFDEAQIARKPTRCTAFTAFAVSVKS
ncbi:PAS domain-containing protein [Aurantimonas sp. A2-1-M11]|uniref:PAS domain-containing protein n=1 Tax=Aurantimonas sp. A2-1-M11 TaxID=3113712 RepID=UPI002F926464